MVGRNCRRRQRRAASQRAEPANARLDLLTCIVCGRGGAAGRRAYRARLTRCPTPSTTPSLLRACPTAASGYPWGKLGTFPAAPSAPSSTALQVLKTLKHLLESSPTLEAPGEPFVEVENVHGPERNSSRLRGARGAHACASAATACSARSASSSENPAASALS
eukprot:5665138-Prymnesium_polylepis.1